METPSAYTGRFASRTSPLCRYVEVEQVLSVPEALQRVHRLSNLLLQDVLHCMVLSEAVYKAYEGGPAAVPPALAALQGSFHPSLCALDTVQCSLSHVQHR